MLDFVPNHVALDHPWVDAHPEYFVAGTEQDLEREPGNYVRLKTPRERSWPTAATPASRVGRTRCS